jgi:hypothetical protein
MLSPENIRLATEITNNGAYVQTVEVPFDADTPLAGKFVTSLYPLNPAKAPTLTHAVFAEAYALPWNPEDPSPTLSDNLADAKAQHTAAVEYVKDLPDFRPKLDSLGSLDDEKAEEQLQIGAMLGFLNPLSIVVSKREGVTLDTFKHPVEVELV